MPVATLVLGLVAIVLCPLDRSGRLFRLLSRTWSRILFATGGVRVEVRGQENQPEGVPMVLVANHCSHLDPPALIVGLPHGFQFIAKRALFWVPVFGQALWAAGVIPIDRGNRERAVRSMDRAAERVRQGTSVVVFPEGTRSHDGRMQSFKKGAFILAIQAGVPVLPVRVTGTRDLLPRGALFVRPGRIEIEVLPAIPTRGMTFDDRDRLLTETARRLETVEDRDPSPAAARASGLVVS